MTLADKLKALQTATAAHAAAVAALATIGPNEDRLSVLADGDALVDLGGHTAYANVGGRMITLNVVGVDDPRTPAPAAARG